MFARTIFFIFLFSSSVVRADVWPTRAVWSDTYEEIYSNWIRESFGESFFTEGDWAGIKTDCADAVYASRIIFSYLNGLSFSLGQSTPQFSNTTTMFDRIQDPLQRVRAFIDFVNDRTWTGSLAQHTYPISVSRETIVPGVLWQKPGHVELVTRVRDSGVIELRGSWLPGAIRNMITISSLGYVPTNANVGFRRWIWPQNFAVAKRSLRGYDESQIHPPMKSVSALDQYLEIKHFEDEVRTKLARNGRIETSKMRIDRLARDYCALIHARADVVELGHEYVEQVSRCLNEREYYAYSTPSRDNGLRRVVFSLGLELQNDLGRVEMAVKNCPAVTASGVEVDPYQFLRKLLKLEFSSDPHQNPSVRFGLIPPELICVGPDGFESDSGS